MNNITGIRYVISALFLFLVAALMGNSPLWAQGEMSAQGQSMQKFPEIIQLPEGFAPEGIATGQGTSFYVGSLAGGAIYRGDLRTGEGEILVPQQQEEISVGMNVDESRNLLFVAGGRNGTAKVFNAGNGEQEAKYTLSTEKNAFINDVIVTKDGAYFTNSAKSVIYHIPLGSGNALPDEGDIEGIPLGENYQSVEGFNTNGIEATPNGKQLIIVNSSTGKLYTVDPASGEVSEIDLGGANVRNGDGILLDGKTLYVVQNQKNQIAVVNLSADFASGEVVAHITHEAFAVPTTVAMHGNYLYAVNAKFGTEPQGTSYEVVRVEKK